MSRSKADEKRPRGDEGILAVLHRSGGLWRGLAADVRAVRPKILDARTFAADATAGIDGWLSEHSAGRVLVVLPGANAICRTCSLPNSSPEQLDMALRLQAETHLLGAVPPHRMAMAVLEAAPGETSRTGLILAWPEAARPNLPQVPIEPRYTTEVAALAGLLNGSRPEEPLLWVDRAEGTVALALSHPGGMIFRATRENARDAGAWSQCVGRAVAESALSVGHSGEFVEHATRCTQRVIGAVATDDSLLSIPPSLLSRVRERIDGTGTDAAWWTHYGLAAGAALAASGALGSLTTMLAAAPIEKPSVVDHAITTMSTRRFARIAVVAAILAIILAPLIFSFIHLSILKLKLPDAQASRRAVDEAKGQLVMYKNLSERVWPMAKLLSDVVAAAPMGIELDSVRIAQGEGINIRGRTIPHPPRDARENVLLMEQYLRDSGLFDDVKINWGDRNNYGGYEFGLTAKVSRSPHVAAKFDDDLNYAAKTLRERIYGPKPADSGLASAGGSGRDSETIRTGGGMSEPMDYPNGSDAGEPDESAIARGPEQPQSEGPIFQSPGGGPTRPRGGDDAPVSGAGVPEPLTEAQINAMSIEEVRQALSRVARARQNRNLDDAVRARLQKEWDLLLARTRSRG